MNNDICIHTFMHVPNMNRMWQVSDWNIVIVEKHDVSMQVLQAVVNVHEDTETYLYMHSIPVS